MRNIRTNILDQEFLESNLILFIRAFKISSKVEEKAFFLF